jgi:flagellar motor switch protein FliM
MSAADDMSASWAAEEDADDWSPGEAGGGSPGDERVLNQDEIDNLLGFDMSEDGSDKTGVKAIINSALVSYERCRCWRSCSTAWCG